MAIKTDAQLKTELDTTFYTNGANLSTGALTNTHLTNCLDSKVSILDAETINGVKTFGSFPVTPSSSPTTDYQVANKKYVDDTTTAAAAAVTPKIFSSIVTATVTNTTTETTIIGNGDGSKTLAANSLAVGDVIKVNSMGVVTNGNVGDENITIRIKLGSTTVSSVTGSITATASDWEWIFDGVFTVRTIGALGTLQFTGYAMIEARSATNTWVVASMTNTSATTIDTTASQTVDLTVQWANADTDLSISGINNVIEKV